VNPDRTDILGTSYFIDLSMKRQVIESTTYIIQHRHTARIGKLSYRCDTWLSTK